jgi:hypothetical protein
MFQSTGSGAVGVEVSARTVSPSNWLAEQALRIRRRIRTAAEFVYMLLTGPF